MPASRSTPCICRLVAALPGGIPVALLGVLKATGARSVAHGARVGGAARRRGVPVRRIVLERAVEVGHYHVRQHLGPLLDYDARRGSELVKTLQAYFDAGGSPRHAATDLHVHVNTVSQRLERISALLGPHWQRPDDALELQLALRLMRLQLTRFSAGGSPTP